MGSSSLGVEGGSQAFEEQATEQAGERLDGEKEVRPPGDPVRPIERETAAWRDAMHVWMMRQRLPPCVLPRRTFGPRRTARDERDRCLSHSRARWSRRGVRRLRRGEERFGAVYSDRIGHPPLPTRLMAWLWILKQLLPALLRGTVRNLCGGP